VKPTKEDDVQPDPELLADARSIREAMHRMVRYSSDATEKLDERIEAETLDGRSEVVELREALDRVQTLSLEVSEELWTRISSGTPARGSSRLLHRHAA
jgi:hypothetical protein